jgi:pentatricopeptide repeat protein
MTSQPIGLQQSISFGEDFELDLRPRRLRRGGHLLKLERIPLEILVLLLEHPGEIVTRDEIVARVWGKGVFLDTNNSIRGAIRKIRHVLKDYPEQPRFIQTVTGQGYRFIAPVVSHPTEENQADVSTHEEEKKLRVEAPVQAEADDGPGILGVGRWLVLGLVAGLALAIIYAMLKSRPTEVTAPKIKSLAVLPLKNLSGDPGQEYFADGMTEAVIGRLSTIRGLRVISRTSVMRLKDTRTSVPEIARTLGVDAIVEGSVIREGDRVRVHAQLIRGATDDHFWSEEYDREVEDTLALESDIAQAIAQKVEVTVTGEERTRLVAARHVSPEVYESYLKGEFGKSNSKAEVEESIAHFEDAIRKDPTFAPAYVSLASAYEELGTVSKGAPPEEVRPKVISAARRALKLDPGLAEAHVLLAEVYQRRWQWTDAEAEYRQALALNPNDASAHLGLADWLLCQGHTEEALAWSRRARELDPLGVTGTSIGWILFQSHRYDDAIRELRTSLSVRRDNATAHWFLGYALIANGHPDDAIQELEKARSLSDGSSAVIGVLIRAYAHAGRRTEALRLLHELKRRKQRGYVPAGAFVNAYLGIDDKEQAFAWLERAYQEKSNILQWLKVHPHFDPLRTDPRFADLLHRVDLDQAR